MRYFAKIENGIVADVIVGDGPKDDSWVETFIDENYAGIGMSYNGSFFYGPSPFPSWVLDDSGDWQAPSKRPSEKHYWDEDNLQWTPTP